jgi:polyisoprenoid-binding protein YceI
MKHLPIFASLVLAAVTTAPLTAQATHDPATVPTGTFRSDPNHTLVTFDVNHFGFTEFYGTFPKATGTLTLNRDAVRDGFVDVTVPIARVSTTNETLDGELRSAEWFDAQRFPTARFVSRRVVRTGPRSARIEGSVTLHGVTRPMTLVADFRGAGVNPLSKAYTVGFKATGHLRRSDFGVAKYVPLVGDDVTLTIAAAFEKTN